MTSLSASQSRAKACRTAVALLCAASLATSASLAVATAARAQSNEFCNGEIMPLIKQRDSLTLRLKAIGKQGAQPGAREKFCGTLDQYMGVIRKTVSYMETNKEFCSIPDQAIAGIKKGLAQNVSLRYKVCVVGAKQAAQAQQQAQAAQAQQQRPGNIKPPSDLNLQ